MPILLPGEFSENIRIYVVEAKERKRPLSSEINAFQEKTISRVGKIHCEQKQLPVYRILNLHVCRVNNSDVVAV